jgi:hypothetical protein
MKTIGFRRSFAARASGHHRSRRGASRVVDAMPHFGILSISKTGWFVERFAERERRPRVRSGGRLSPQRIPV